MNPFELEQVRKLYHTSRWQTTKNHVIERCGGRCQMCHRMITDRFIVHHIHIATLSNFFDENNLTLLCIECHNTVTFHYGVNKNGNQTYKDLPEYDSLLKYMLKDDNNVKNIEF